MDHTLGKRQAAERQREGFSSDAKVHVQWGFSSSLCPKIKGQSLRCLEEFLVAVEHSKTLSLQVMHISGK